MPKSADVIESSDDDVELEITADKPKSSSADGFTRFENALKSSPAGKAPQSSQLPTQRGIEGFLQVTKSGNNPTHQSKLAAVLKTAEWGKERAGPRPSTYDDDRITNRRPAGASYSSPSPLKNTSSHNNAPYQLSADSKKPSRTYGTHSTSSRPSASSDVSSLQRLLAPGRISSGTPATSLRGLSNLGNTCYMNACLIALLHTPAFVRVLLDASLHKLNMYHAQMKKSGGNSSSLATPTKAPQPSAHRRGARASCFSSDPEFIEFLRNADVSVPLNFRRSMPFPLQDIHWVLHNEDKRIADPLSAFGIISPRTAAGVAVSSAMRSLATRRLAGEITSDDVLVRFKTALGKADDIFAGNEQQDAHELLARVLSKLEEEGQVVQTEVVAINGLAAVDGLDPKLALQYTDHVQTFLSKMTQTEDDGLPQICLNDQAAFEVDGVSPEEEEVLKRAAQVRAQAAYTSKRTLITSRTCSSVVRATIQCSNPSCGYRRFTFESYHTLSVDLPDVSSSPTAAEIRRKKRDAAKEAAAAPQSTKPTCSSIMVDDADDEADGIVPGPAAKRPRKASGEVEQEEAVDPLLFDIESMYHYADVASGYPPPKEHQLPPKVFGLLALLKYFFRPIRVSLNCPKPGCGCKSAVITYKLVSMPRVLILHIKRFEFTMDGDCVKRLDFVSIPPTIDLAEMCDDTIQLPPPMDLRHPDEVNDEIAQERAKLAESRAESRQDVAAAVKAEPVPIKRLVENAAPVNMDSLPVKRIAPATPLSSMLSEETSNTSKYFSAPVKSGEAPVGTPIRMPTVGTHLQTTPQQPTPPRSLVMESKHTVTRVTGHNTLNVSVVPSRAGAYQPDVRKDKHAGIASTLGMVKGGGGSRGYDMSSARYSANSLISDGSSSSRVAPRETSEEPAYRRSDQSRSAYDCSSSNGASSSIYVGVETGSNDDASTGYSRLPASALGSSSNNTSYDNVSDLAFSRFRDAHCNGRGRLLGSGRHRPVVPDEDDGNAETTLCPSCSLPHVDRVAVCRRCGAAMGGNSGPPLTAGLTVTALPNKEIKRLRKLAPAKPAVDKKGYVSDSSVDISDAEGAARSGSEDDLTKALRESMKYVKKKDQKPPQNENIIQELDEKQGRASVTFDDYVSPSVAAALECLSQDPAPAAVPQAHIPDNDMMDLTSDVYSAKHVPASKPAARVDLDVDAEVDVDVDAIGEREDAPANPWVEFERALGSTQPAGAGINCATSSASTRYHLHAILRHEGRQAFRGHYTCDVRGKFSTDPTHQLGTAEFAREDPKNALWHRYDDSSVSSKRMNDVLSPDGQRQAYMLFYTLQEAAPVVEEDILWVS